VNLVQRLGAQLSRLTPLQAMGLCVALAIILSLPSLWTGFCLDDHFFRLVFKGAPGLHGVQISKFDTFSFNNGDPEQTRLRMELGVLPWWAIPDARFAFFRPLTSLSHYLDWRIWGDSAWPMHLHNILLYGLLVAAVSLLYRRLMAPPWLAIFAALLYAIDDAHSIPVGWLSNRNALLAALFGVLTLILHDVGRTNRSLPARIFAPVMLVVGLLSGEAAVAVGAYLFAYAIFRDPAGKVRGMLALAPYLVVVVVWRMIYNRLGYGVVGSALYLDPGADPVRFAQSVVQHLPMLMLGQFALPDPSFWVGLPAVWQWGWVGLALAVMLAIGWAVWPLVRTDRMTRFWLVGTVLAAVPACATVPQNRMLIFVGIGGAALVAQFLRSVVEQAPPLWANRGRRAVALALVVIHIVLAPVFLALGSVSMAVPERELREMAASLPMDPAIRDKTVIVLSAPSDLVSMFLPAMRSSLGEPVPGRLFLLSAGLDPVTVERRDDRTLVLTPARGFLTKPWAQICHDPRQFPMEQGDQVTLKGMQVEVLEVNNEGRPTRVAFRFDQSLGSARYLCYTWRDGHYVAVSLPEPGQQVALPGLSLRHLAEQFVKGSKTSPAAQVLPLVKHQ